MLTINEYWVYNLYVKKIIITIFIILLVYVVASVISLFTNPLDDKVAKSIPRFPNSVGWEAKADAGGPDSSRNGEVVFYTESNDREIVDYYTEKLSQEGWRKISDKELVDYYLESLPQRVREIEGAEKRLYESIRSDHGIAIFNKKIGSHWYSITIYKEGFLGDAQDNKNRFLFYISHSRCESKYPFPEACIFFKLNQ